MPSTAAVAPTRVVVAASIPPATAAALEDLARADDRTLSYVIRRILMAAVKDGNGALPGAAAQIPAKVGPSGGAG